MTRIQFLKFLVATIGLSFISLFGCEAKHETLDGSGDDGDDDGSDGGENDTCTSGATTTYTNPGHAHTETNLTTQQVEDAVAGVYSVLGGGHSHTVNLTAQDFSDLKNGLTVSTTDIEAHGHTIDFIC